MAIGGSILFFVLFFRGLAVSTPILLGALVTGHIAIRQIKRTGERGGRIAVTGLLIGYACAAFLILTFGVPLLFLGMWRTDAP